MLSRERHERVWEAIPEGLSPAQLALRENFLLANVGAGERVLDLGCGEGSFSAALARAGAHPLAADVAEEPLRRARARHPRLELLRLALSRAAFTEHFDPRGEHLRFYSRDTLARLLEDFRFEDVEVRLSGRLAGARVLLARAVRSRF